FGNRSVGLSQVPNQPPTLFPHAPVVLLVLVEHRLHHTGQYASALLEEEVGQREQALGKVGVESSHRVGDATLSVPTQKIGLHRVVARRILVGPNTTREVVAPEVQQRGLKIP